MAPTYAACIEHPQDPASRSGAAALDRIRVGFDEATDLFGASMFMWTASFTGAACRRSESDIQRLASETERLGSKRQAALHEATSLRAALAAEQIGRWKPTDSMRRMRQLSAPR